MCSSDDTVEMFCRKFLDDDNYEISADTTHTGRHQLDSLVIHVVFLCDGFDRSFLLSVDLHTLKGSGKVTKYRYEVKRLPAEIDPKKSRYEV